MSQDSTEREKDRFAEQVKKALRDAGDTTEFRYDRKEFGLFSDDNKPGLLLGNAFHQFSAVVPHQREEVLRHFVRGWLTRYKSLPTEYSDARPDVLPAIRSKARLDIERLRKDQPGAEADQSQPVSDHLAAIVCYDRRESIVPVSPQLPGWQVSFDAVYRDALDNLRSNSNGGLQQRSEGLWQAAWQDSYDSSRLLLPDLIRAHAVKGAHIAVVPNRDTLLVTGSQDHLGLEAMFFAVAEAWKRPYQISAIPMRLEADRWLPFLPAPAHPLYQGFHSLYALSSHAWYSSQREVLVEHLKREGKVEYVADYLVRIDPPDDLTSDCHWPEGFTTLLPRADTVWFISDDAVNNRDPVLRATWDQVEAVVGELLQPMGLFPERYRVERFPEKYELEALRAAGAVDLPVPPAHQPPTDDSDGD